MGNASLRKNQLSRLAKRIIAVTLAHEQIIIPRKVWI